MSAPLAQAVTDFVRDVGETLDALANASSGHYDNECIREASDIVLAVLDSDGRLTDGELDAYLDSIGPLLDPPLLITASDLRQMRLAADKAAWLSQRSVLYDLLVNADSKNGTTTSNVYYDRSIQLAHHTAALDLVPSAAEIQSIDQFRTMMLVAMDDHSVARPGRPSPKPIDQEPATIDRSISADRPTQPAAPGSASATTAAPGSPISGSSQQPGRSLPELLEELDQLVGLANVKSEVRRLTSMLQVQQLRAERNLPVIETSHHLVFTGNPGTGKTTVARLLSQIYRTVGVVSGGQLIETDRSKLVAGFVGQTALKTQQALESALGGMLLIDEAYALARGGDTDFGREAIDTLVKFMEDHRDDVAIVAAGYTTEMAQFIDANPGLKSRFTRTITFPDYTNDELLAIFIRLGEKNSYLCSDDALSQVRHFIAVEPRGQGFGNARFVRNLFETAVAHQAQRIAPLTDPSTEQLTTLIAADIATVDT